MKRHRGGVLNVASVAGFVPGPGMAVYFATKAFVLSVQRGIGWRRLAGTGIKVMALCPGPTGTNFGKVANFNTNSRLVRVAKMTAKDVAQRGTEILEAGASWPFQAGETVCWFC